MTRFFRTSEEDVYVLARNQAFEHIDRLNKARKRSGLRARRMRMVCIEVLGISVPVYTVKFCTHGIAVVIGREDIYFAYTQVI